MRVVGIASGAADMSRRFYRPFSRRFLAPDVAHLDLRQGGGRFRAELRVAVGALSPDPGDRVAQLVVRRAATDERAQVVAPEPEEAGVEPALRRDPGARAVAAERLRDRRDQTDLARSVPVAPALRDLASVARFDRLERELGGDAFGDLGGR